MKLIYEESAIVDLVDIWHECVSRSGAGPANALLDAIHNATSKTLLTFPGGGRFRPEFGPDIRSLPASRYLVFYYVAGSEIRVLRVLHGRRRFAGDLMSMLVAA